MEAVRCGLLNDLHEATGQRMYESQVFGLFWITRRARGCEGSGCGRMDSGSL
jgi:hypothetical protein